MPHVLIVADSDASRVASIVRAYTSASSTGRVGTFRPTSDAALLIGLRSRLATAAGISAGLIVMFGTQPTGTIDLEQEPTAHGGLRMPVRREGRRLFHPRFRVFVECLDSGYFYTIDNARRAAMVKRYTVTATHLEWDADLDGDGKVLPKHKGRVGLRIPLSECSGARRRNTRPTVRDHAGTLTRTVSR